MPQPVTNRHAVSGIAMILCATLLFPMMDAGVKYVSAFLPLARLALLDDPYTTQFYAGVTGTILLTPFVVLRAAGSAQVLHEAAPLHLGLPLLIGGFGTIGHLLLVMAFSRAATASLMPFIYAQIAFAAVLGWLVFATMPDLWAWIGMAFISLCGAVSAWFNMREAQRAGRPPAVLEPAAD